LEIIANQVRFEFTPTLAQARKVLTRLDNSPLLCELVTNAKNLAKKGLEDRVLEKQRELNNILAPDTLDVEKYASPHLICLFIYLFICLFVYLFIYLFIDLVYLFIIIVQLFVVFTFEFVG
jgi:hypothetical protein